MKQSCSACDSAYWNKKTTQWRLWWGKERQRSQKQDFKEEEATKSYCLFTSWKLEQSAYYQVNTYFYYRHQNKSINKIYKPSAIYYSTGKISQVSINLIMEKTTEAINNEVIQDQGRS